MSEMRKIDYHIVEAFTNRPFTGNPAGIITDVKDLSDFEMQQITREFCTEFGFFQPGTADQSDFCVRFFTSHCEAHISGHVAIAGCYTLFQKGLVPFPDTISQSSISIDTKAGKRYLELYRNESGDISISFNLDKPRFGKIYDPKLIEANLELPLKSVLATRLWPEVVSTGIRVLVIPLRNREILLHYKPNFQKIAEFSKILNIGGPVFCTMETLDSQADIYCRYFFPQYGTNEDISSGVAMGAVSCYLVRQGILSAENAVQITSEQGHTLNRPNKITAKIELDHGKHIVSVHIIGQATMVASGTLILP